MTKGDAMEKLDQARELMGEVYTGLHDEDTEFALFESRIQLDVARLRISTGRSYATCLAEARNVRQGEPTPT